MLRKRRIVIGVTGGIAAYKTCELVRLCVKAGAEVRVAMTPHATEFVTPLSFEALCHSPVISDADGKLSARHIELARWAEIVVVAPATANTMAKIAHGIADCFLTTLVLATRAPVVIAPAMNSVMWEAAATRRNVALLGELGHTVTPTGWGQMAEPEVGEGRMLEPAEIMHHLMRALPRVGPLAGRTVMVTAGPTPEPLDPVRVLTNRSSGKMGVAIGRMAVGMGAQVVFVHGPLQVPPPPGADAIPVETAQEMCDAVLAHLPRVDALVMAAAVADFRAADVHAQKIKKAAAAAGGKMILELVLTPDILSEVARRKAHQIVVGFAMETDAFEAERHVRDRMERKDLDMTVLNMLGEPGAGFSADTNRVTIYRRGGSAEPLPLMAKEEVARAIWERVVPLLPTEQETPDLQDPSDGRP